MKKILLLLLCMITSISADVVNIPLRAKFSWDAVPNQSVDGYKIHWGTQSGVYDHYIDTGNVTEMIVSGFSEGVEYFAVGTAYNSNGEESDYSSEVSFRCFKVIISPPPPIDVKMELSPYVVKERNKTGMQINITGPPKKVITIQASTNNVIWKNVKTITLSAEGKYTYNYVYSSKVKLSFRLTYK